MTSRIDGTGTTQQKQESHALRNRGIALGTGAAVGAAVSAGLEGWGQKTLLKQGEKGLAQRIILRAASIDDKLAKKILKDKNWNKTYTQIKVNNDSVVISKGKKVLSTIRDAGVLKQAQALTKFVKKGKYDFAMMGKAGALGAAITGGLYLLYKGAESLFKGDK